MSLFVAGFISGFALCAAFCIHELRRNRFNGNGKREEL